TRDKSYTDARLGLRSDARQRKGGRATEKGLTRALLTRDLRQFTRDKTSETGQSRFL
ncbi:hypothetical protein KI387_012316, partial [Taxus chinensis]